MVVEVVFARKEHEGDQDGCALREAAGDRWGGGLLLRLGLGLGLGSRLLLERLGLFLAMLGLEEDLDARILDETFELRRRWHQSADVPARELQAEGA